MVFCVSQVPLFYFPEFLLSFYPFVALQKFQSFSSFWFLASFCFYSLSVTMLLVVCGVSSLFIPFDLYF